MLKSEKTTEKILQDIESKDSFRIWEGTCAIISQSQEPEFIKSFIPHLSHIKEVTQDLEMGGAVAPNQRFIDFAIKTIEFHQNNIGCPCALYPEAKMDSMFNPLHAEAEKYVEIVDKVTFEGSNYVDYYIVKCLRCGQKYKVLEREYHFMGWQWIKI